MKKSNNNKIHRRINDMTMISLCVFALVGGLLVVRSFAQQNNTRIPTVVSAKELKVSTDANYSRYELATNDKLLYCFEVKGSTQRSIIILEYGARTQRLEYSPGQQSVCFRPIKSAEKVTITLNKFLILDKLIVTQPN